MAKVIVLNADDWGLSAQIHTAITELGDAGAIDAAGIMMGQEFTQEAVAYAERRRELLVGLHLFVNDPTSQPLTLAAWPAGWPRGPEVHARLALGLDRTLILAEVEAQLLAYRATGLRLDFVNSHFQVHAHPMVGAAIRAKIRTVFPKFSGWVRYGAIRLFPFGPVPILRRLPDLLTQCLLTPVQEGVTRWEGRTNDTLWGLDSTFRNRPAQLLATMAQLGDGFHEFMFHPGRRWKLSDPPGSDQSALMEVARRRGLLRPQ